jgi:TetR/AcrR family transcriptional repressor of bet genes
VNAIINASFSDKQFDGQVFSAWLALYGNARQSERLKRILKLYHRRLHANLMAELSKFMDRKSSAKLAEGIGAMIDGLWLRYALTGKPENPEHPRAITRSYFEAAAGFDHF